MKEKGFFQSRVQAIKIAFDGLSHVLRTQPNIKVYSVISLAVIAAGWVLNISQPEWILLVITIGLVWAAEAFNTAIEELVDLVSPEENSQAKTIKDISAGAVLICALLSIVVGILIFGPRLWSWFVGTLN